MKKKVFELAELTKDMSDPRIIITPVFSLTDVEWKQLLYAFEDLRSSIEKMTKTVLVLNVIDGDDEIDEDIQLEKEMLSYLEKEDDDFLPHDVRID
jgi:hypothetical protein